MMSTSKVHEQVGELMRCHIKINHLQFSKLKMMPNIGIIPKRLAKVAKTNACVFMLVA